MGSPDHRYLLATLPSLQRTSRSSTGPNARDISGRQRCEGVLALEWQCASTHRLPQFNFDAETNSILLVPGSFPLRMTHYSSAARKLKTTDDVLPVLLSLSAIVCACEHPHTHAAGCPMQAAEVVFAM